MWLFFTYLIKKEKFHFDLTRDLFSAWIVEVNCEVILMKILTIFRLYSRLSVGHVRQSKVIKSEGDGSLHNVSWLYCDEPAPWVSNGFSTCSYLYENFSYMTTAPTCCIYTWAIRLAEYVDNDQRPLSASVSRLCHFLPLVSLNVRSSLSSDLFSIVAIYTANLFLSFTLYLPSFLDWILILIYDRFHEFR